MPTDNENTISAPSETGPSDPSRRSLLAGSAGLGLAAAVPAATAAAQSAETRSREFAGRSAFITGGARGIGYATAEALARAGADIMLYDVAGQIEHVKYPLATPEDLAKVKANIEALGV